jgi:formylmethanofuran dehydrogenase subunit A
MFERPRWVIMGGRIAAEDGDIRESLFGDTHFVLPEYDQGALPGIADWFQQHYTVQFRNYHVDDHYVENPSVIACEASI